MSHDAIEAIAEAARWRLLGLLLERPRPGWAEEVRALAREVREPSLESVAARAQAALEGSYLALLGPASLVSPREVAYRGLADPGWVLADIQHYYEAFAYRPQTEDPIDHVAVETGFIAYLLLKEEMARTDGNEGGAQLTAAARTAFVAAHLGPLAAPLARALAACGDSYLGAAVALVAARLPACETVPPSEVVTVPLDCLRCPGVAVEVG